MGSAEAGVGSALHLGISLHPLLLAPPFPQVPSPAHSVTSIPHTELHRRGCLSRRVTYSRTTPFRWTLAPSRPGTQVRRLGRSALLASSPLCYGVPLSAWTDGRMTHGKQSGRPLPCRWLLSHSPSLLHALLPPFLASTRRRFRNMLRKPFKWRFEPHTQSHIFLIIMAGCSEKFLARFSDATDEL